MILIPIKTTIEPKISNLSGFFLSIQYPHSKEDTTKIPPYAAYTFPKFSGCKVITTLYENKIRPPINPIILPW
jgi:hypothetical protein